MPIPRRNVQGSSNQLLNTIDRPEEEEALQFENLRLRADDVKEASLRHVPAHRAPGDAAIEDCAHGLASRVLNHKEEASEDDASQDADNKVPQCHHNDDDHDGEVFPAIDAADRVPQ